MKTYRIMAVILIALILGEFALMIVALLRGEYSQFFIDGGVLVAMILAGLLLKRAVAHEREKETQDSGDTEGNAQE